MLLLPLLQLSLLLHLLLKRGHLASATRNVTYDDYCYAYYCSG